MSKIIITYNQPAYQPAYQPINQPIIRLMRSPTFINGQTNIQLHTNLIRPHLAGLVGVNEQSGLYPVPPDLHTMPLAIIQATPQLELDRLLVGLDKVYPQTYSSFGDGHL